jgi:4-amino-4-deoxy-L-arabinose transferase-like glycosyltransferase
MAQGMGHGVPFFLLGYFLKVFSNEAPADAESPPPSEASAGFYSAGLAAFLVILTGYRFWALGAADLQLYFDEAYYWGWSRELALGYYSKPPMIAWVIRGATEVCGDGERCIRSVPILLFAATAWIVSRIGGRLFGPKVGFWSGLAFASLPVVSFYSWLMTTDALLLFCWALALWGFARALDTGRAADWLLAGLGLGLGLLSKYTMAVSLASVLVFALWVPARRRAIFNIRAEIGLNLAFAIFLPNLCWNIVNGYPSFRHTAESAHWGGDMIRPDRLLEFLGAQFLLFGPVLALGLIAALVRLRGAVLNDERYRLLLSFSVPLLAMYSVQAFLARANFNWAAAALLPAAILAAAGLVRAGWTRFLAAALAVNFILGSALYHYEAAAERLGYPLGRKTDIYGWMKGWRELAQQVQPVLARYPEARLLGENRRALAELIYYLKPHPFNALIWNPSGKPSDNFKLKVDIRDSPDGEFIFLAEESPPEAVRAAFESVEDLGPVEVPLYKDYARRYHLFRTRKFLGYP